MNRNLLVTCIAYFFILLFLYTGVEKLMDIHSFKDQMLSSPVTGPVAGLVAWALPITEILVAIILFIPAWRLRGLYASLVLMILFTIYLVVILLIDNHLSCSCGGIIEDLSPRQHLLFNAAAIFLAALAISTARWTHISPRFRWVGTIGAFFLGSIIGWIIFTATKAPAKVKTGFEGRLLPEFSLLMPDSLTWLDTRDIPVGKPFIMVGFNPYCKHCQAEMLDIVRHITRFGDTAIYFVTPFPYSDMKKFYEAFQLSRYPDIIVGLDSKNVFLSYFKAPGIPYTTVFDSKKRLKEAIPGQADVARLCQCLDD